MNLPRIPDLWLVVKIALLLGLTIIAVIVCTMEQRVLSVDEAIASATPGGRRVKVSGYYHPGVETESLASGNLEKGDSARFIFLYPPGPYQTLKTSEDLAKVLLRLPEMRRREKRLAGKYVTVRGQLFRGRPPLFPWGKDTVFMIYDQIDVELGP